ncbi:MAG: FAD binding domain-containing protein [Polaromonas sp.]|uniref:xanthine dehydrogenase small subunit n=1 Tax=Polaromonas sp. TaxID=1869339 RepID=UPI0024872872|nr:FAD binding domain-containing protein [Polaromonas sp.]MDI1239827.1 FAD binding domain-containing protein [Polaromonas sp.]
MDIQSPLKTIQFIRGGEVVALANVPPSRTLLEVLREDLGCTGTKEGCGEGDCGACTVVVGEAEGGRIRYRAVNSCIKLAHSIDGQALWTVEDLAADDGTLHPAQEAMVQCHGSQCGFCTPGFVMSLFGMYQNHVSKGQTITRELAQQELSGNLCRCTGYRPILDAAQQMATLPAVPVDVTLLSKLELLAQTRQGLGADSAYNAPQTLAGLLAARAAYPEAQLVAGCTDVGLWVTKMHMQFGQVLDVTRVTELRRVEHYAHHIAIGAAVTLSDAFAALVTDRPQLQAFAHRFAGLPVRNAGTLGGNVANGSPIGDSMPLLIALGANVVLMSVRGHRELPLEQLYTGYRKNVMAKDEVLAWVKVPKPGSPHPNPLPEGEGKTPNAPTPSPHRGEGRGEGQELLRVYKISKRYDDDISAVCLALNLQIEDGKVLKASIGAGGVAATPVRAARTEAALAGQPWSQATVRRAITTLRAEFSPISDMRASGAYRSEVLGNLLQRFWLESQGLQQINLESFVLVEESA